MRRKDDPAQAHNAQMPAEEIPDPGAAAPLAPDPVTVQLSQDGMYLLVYLAPDAPGLPRERLVTSLRERCARLPLEHATCSGTRSLCVSRARRTSRRVRTPT